MLTETISGILVATTIDSKFVFNMQREREREGRKEGEITQSLIRSVLCFFFSCVKYQIHRLLIFTFLRIYRGWNVRTLRGASLRMYRNSQSMSRKMISRLDKRQIYAQLSNTAISSRFPRASLSIATSVTSSFNRFNTKRVHAS